jgi:hypothetical protein
MRKAEASHTDEPGDVDVEDGRLVLLARLIEGRASEREAGVVDEDVETAELLDGCRDESFAAAGVHHVELECDRSLEPAGASRTPGHADADGGKGARGRAPYA